MITVTFVRHGESEDNLRAVWAGWKDAPLSELGKKQAKALGEYFSTINITHVYASPLMRAHSTGLSVHSHQPDPKPTFTVDPNLREQNFGVAEGHPWVMEPEIHKHTPHEELWAKNIFPILYGRDEKFPEGETLDDVAARADVAIRECVVLHLNEDSGIHVVLASHGLAIGELVSALLRLDPKADQTQVHTGLENTAWTRVHVSVRDGHEKTVDPTNPPPLKVTVTHQNEVEHLKHLKDVPPLHEGLDGAHAEARAFFGGDRTRVV